MSRPLSSAPFDPPCIAISNHAYARTVDAQGVPDTFAAASNHPDWCSRFGEYSQLRERVMQRVANTAAAMETCFIVREVVACRMGAFDISHPLVLLGRTSKPSGLFQQTESRLAARQRLHLR